MGSNKIIICLVVVITLLLGFIAYTFLIRPAVINYNNKMRDQGYQHAIVTIMQQVTSCQPVPLTFESITINVVAMNCLQNPEE